MSVGADSTVHHPYDNDTIHGAARTFNEGMLAGFRAMYGLDHVLMRHVGDRSAEKTTA